MVYPFRTSITNSGVYAHHRSIDGAEDAAYKQLRAGATSVDVEYLNHRVARLTQAELAQVVLDDDTTFLIHRIKAGVEKLGPNPRPLPSGTRQREVKRIIEEACLGLLTPQAVYQQLRPYLNNFDRETLW